MSSTIQISSLTMKELIERSLESEKLINDEDVLSLLREATDYTASYLKSMPPEQLFDKLSSIISQMELWYTDFNNKKNLFEKRRFLNYRNVVRHSQLSNVAGVSEREVVNYYKNKNNNASREYQKYKEDLAKSFLQGFALWEAFRSYAVGQSINYSILYSNNKVLYEARAITLEELLKRGNFSLKYDKLGNGSLSYKIAINSLEQEEDEIFGGTIFYNQLLSKYGRYARNVGAIYETYEEIRQNFNNFPVERGVTEKWFSNKYKMNKTLIQKVKDNDIDWASGRRVGDQGLTQNKNISQNAAYLSAIQTLPKEIAELINVFKTGTRSEIIETLIRLLTEDINKGNIHLTKQTEELNELAKQTIIKQFS